jgi:hypothetical protein
MRIRVALGAAALTTILGVLVFAQETQKVPGFGSGIMKIQGTVDIANTPIVLSHQSGDWKMIVASMPDVRVASMPDVRVASMPNVSMAAPEFVTKGGRYQITWSTGERQVIRVAHVASGGWIRVDSAGERERWVNLATARSVDGME